MLVIWAVGLRAQDTRTVTEPRIPRVCTALNAKLVAQSGTLAEGADEENEERVRCVGAAVLNYSGRPVGAISVSGPVFSITKEKLPKVSRSVIAAARGSSAELGHQTSCRPTTSGGQNQAYRAPRQETSRL